HSQQLQGSRGDCVGRRSCDIIACKVIRGAGVTDPGYNVREAPERCFQYTASAKSFRCVGKDFRAALLTNSNYAGHRTRISRIQSNSSPEDYFGAREATMLSKHGSPRSGSQYGISFNWP